MTILKDNLFVTWDYVLVWKLLKSYMVVENCERDGQGRLEEKVSYPSWHSKYKVSKQFEPRDGQNRGQGQVTVAHVESGNVSFTPQQFGQLLRSFQIKNAAADDDFAVVSDFATKELTELGLGNTKRGQAGLGHVSDSKLKHMKDLPVVMSKSHSAECLSCLMAKFSILRYAQSDSHSTEVVELIHIDIWGAYKVATADKYRYFLEIVYDCNRANWTYLLVHKSDSFLALRAFIKFVHTQFNKSIKVVRSDNALEFVKGECGPYLQSQGIEHLTLCVDRPQQNGRVERKHKHILDNARALRFHYHLSLKFWGDCVTTTTFLINRLPSFVMRNKTPYEILFSQVPSYSHLRVFGSFAIVSNPFEIPDKFAPKGTACVF
ncbi:retrovirus-related pol polyprotein from transposon TNT 1-94 [Tanacetum coccineum]